MRKCALLIVLSLTLQSVFCMGQNKKSGLLTPFERSNGKQSATWEEAIEFYKALDSYSNKISLSRIGTADGGYPLNKVTYSNNTTGDKILIFINNGIHAGEPDGVDACMMLLRDAAEGKIQIPDNVVLTVIPVYNIGGFVNRGSYSRANQNGPEAYGFRGNGKNLDLNRDFIKCDAAETRSLEKAFRELHPDIFIDNHVSDGADYQHVMTLLPTQHDKLGGKTGEFMYNTFTPLIYKDMKAAGYDLVPYVNDFDNTPVNGWREFIEPPRFASGYAALFQTIAYVPETHMLKPFKDRVMATYELMTCVIKEASANATEIKKVRNTDYNELMSAKELTIDWKIDTTRFDKVNFKGYEAAYKPSEVSGLPRLYYDHNRPFTREVPFYDHYIASKTVSVPDAYVIPAAWANVINLLDSAHIRIERLKRDTTITVTAYKIESYDTTPKAYESHYLHKNIRTSTGKIAMKFRKGDCIVRTGQAAKRYIVETLEPEAPDGFFAWNFFDGILQQKEYFSDYVFEDRAAEMLKEDVFLAHELQVKKTTDTAFAKNGAAQLDFVYRHSPYMEPGYMRYPVYRIE